MPRKPAKMTELIAVRLTAEQLESLNEWRRRRPDPPTRAEAIRQLMEIGLEAVAKAEKRKQ